MSVQKGWQRLEIGDVDFYGNKKGREQEAEKCNPDGICRVTIDPNVEKQNSPKSQLANLLRLEAFISYREA